MKKTARFIFFLIFLLSTAFIAAEDIILESDVLKLVLHAQTGTYSLYRKRGENARLASLNDVSDNSSSTFFAVKADETYIPLRPGYGLKVNAVQNADGSASFLWEIGETAQAEIRFSLVEIMPGTPADSVRVDISVMNLAEEDTVFSMKTVIDTVLGERSRIHFTTAKGTAISTEKAYLTMAQDKWLSSSDGMGTLSVLLAGAATAPEYVLASNRDYLLADVWKQVVNAGRTFSSIQSPNNSALGIWYAEKKLKMFESVQYTFFLSTADEGNIPPNAALLGIEPDDEAASISESTVTSASRIVDEAVNAAIPADRPARTVDMEYVQQLFDHIRVLEESDNPDEEEIKKLSAEIDALILELTK